MAGSRLRAAATRVSRPSSKSPTGARLIAIAGTDDESRRFAEALSRCGARAGAGADENTGTSVSPGRAHDAEVFAVELLYGRHRIIGEHHLVREIAELDIRGEHLEDRRVGCPARPRGALGRERRERGRRVPIARARDAILGRRVLAEATAAEDTTRAPIHFCTLRVEVSGREIAPRIAVFGTERADIRMNACRFVRGGAARTARSPRRLHRGQNYTGSATLCQLLTFFRTKTAAVQFGR